jgi:hypothetical protein
LIRAPRRGNTPGHARFEDKPPAAALNSLWRELNAFIYLDPGFDPLLQSLAGVGASDFHFIIAIQGLENSQYGLCFAAGQVHYDA